MDVVLIILGVLGMGAIIIAAYVFTVAARNYVSNDIHDPQNGGLVAPQQRNSFVMRDPRDRRRSSITQFPLTVNSMVIRQDRRAQRDRRETA